MKAYKLDNGLKVYLNNIKNKKIISCGVWINQGAKEEEDYNSGLSHFVEHMMFRSKSKESRFNISTSLNELRKRGAFYNASTSKDNTSFYIEGLSSDYKMFIEILSYIVINKEKTNEAELEKEKEIVLREAEAHFISTSQMPDRIGQALWNNISYGNPVIGKYDNIKKFTCSMVDKLIEESYTPDNSCIVVTGEFEIDQMKQEIERYFSIWTGKCKKKKESNVKFSPHILIDDRFKGNRTTVGIGFPGYSFNDKRSYYLEILKNVLIGSEYRLLHRLRDKEGLLYSLKGYTNAFKDSGNMGIVFSASNDSVEEILTIFIEECRNLREDGIDSEILECLKRKKIVEVLFENQGLTEELISIGKAAANGYVYSLEKYISEIESLNRDEMHEVIREVFKDENICMALLGTAYTEKLKSLLKF